MEQVQQLKQTTCHHLGLVQLPMNQAEKPERFLLAFETETNAETVVEFPETDVKE